MESDKNGEGKLPHIYVKVVFGDEAVRLDGACFIDAISFLCQAEAALRNGLRLKEGDCDTRTMAIQNENMRCLLRGIKGLTIPR